MKPGIKGVFIDFDGTLVDSVNDLYQIYLNFLKNYHSQGTKKEFQELNGPAIHEIIEILIRNHHLPEPSEKLLAYYWTMLLEYYQKIAIPTKGSLEFIKKIKNEGRKVVLVTSADLRLVEPFLERHHLKKSFDCIVTAAGLKKSKPDPAIYLNALKCGDLKPSEAIAVEDSKNGIRAALDAGIFTFCLNFHLKSTKRHAGWIEVSSWNAIAAEMARME